MPPPAAGRTSAWDASNVRTPSGAVLQYQSADFEDDMSDQLLKQAMAPFQSLAETLKRPAWTATFAHHLIDQGDGLDLFFFLFLRQFDKSPTEARARRLYDFFFANHGMTISLDVDHDIVLSIERQLNQATVNLAVLQKLFEKPREDAAALVHDHLAEFATLVGDPARSAATGAPKLISLIDDDESGAMVSEKGVIRSMLLPHLQEIRTSTDKDPERLIHSQQLFTALTEFLEAHGISEGIGARGGSVNGKSWKMQNIKTSHSGAARYKGRKVHTHKGHHFVVTTYTHPTWCDHCGNLLWGLMKQGWKCVDCGFDVHKAKDRTGYTQCHRELAHQCPGFKSKGSIKRQPSSKSNSTEPKSRLSRSPNPSRRGRGDGSQRGRPPQPAELAAMLAQSVDSVDSDSDAGSPAYKQPSRLGPEADGDDDDDDDDDELEDVHTISESELVDPRLTTPKGFKEWCEPSTYKHLEKREKSRQEALYELIRTEYEYTWYLLVLEQVFKKRAQESGVIPQRLLLPMFGNISALVTMHRSFRSSLEEMQKRYAGVAVQSPGPVVRDCLARLEKTEYAQFVSNQDMAREAYNDLDAEGKQLIAECERWEPIAKSRWKLTDFIMQPFQRVVRYPLLLRAILKYTPSSDAAERQAIETAISGSEELLGYLNKVKAEVEIRRRLQKIASTTTYSAEITGPETAWILKMYQQQTEILYEGSLELRNREGKSERGLHGFLFKNALLLLKRQHKSQGAGWEMVRYEGSKGGFLLPICLLGGVHCTENKEERSGTSFYVIRSEPASFVYIGFPQMYELTAPKVSEAKKWIAAIKKANHAFESDNPDWKEVLVERFGSSPQQPSTVTSPDSLLGDDLGMSTLKVVGSPEKMLRRTASERAHARAGSTPVVGSGRVSPRASSLRDSQDIESLATPRKVRHERRESAIADTGAQTHLRKCCGDLLRAIDNFESKAADNHTRVLSSQLASAKAAVETLNRHLYTVAHGLLDEPPQRVGHTLPEDAPVERAESEGSRPRSNTLGAFFHIDTDGFDGSDEFGVPERSATWQGGLPSDCASAMIGTPPPPPRFAETPPLPPGMATSPPDTGGSLDLTVPPYIPPAGYGDSRPVSVGDGPTFDESDDEVFV